MLTSNNEEHLLSLLEKCAQIVGFPTGKHIDFLPDYLKYLMLEYDMLLEEDMNRYHG